MTSLPEHYERCLGEIARGWSDKTQTYGVQIVCFENQPVAGVRTFATLELTNFDSVFAYLVPIAATEAALIGAKGWRWFLDQLKRQNPDIWDLARTKVIEADS